MTVTVNDGHTFGAWTSNGDGTHTRPCSVDGCDGTETEACAGGEANCVEKAVCALCGAVYGTVDENSHKNLVHFPAKAATENAAGTIAYWYCDACGKYFADAAATEEIAKENTVTAKLPTSAETGDPFTPVLWIALLFVSGGVCTMLTVKHKKSYRRGGNTK